MREVIEQVVREALTTLGATDANFIVERPTSLEHGDYATNAALKANVDAQELAGKLKIAGVERIEVVGKFINFFLTREELIPKERPILQLYAGKRVMVEYTDPNPFKEFHVGHLMSNAIGESIARLLETTGAKVTRANYQGDVGIHVAKALWGKIQKPNASWGEAYVYGDQNYEARKEEIEVLNKKIYAKSDEEVHILYESGRKESLEHFEEIYRKLGTKFDFYFFESETGQKGLEIVQTHPEVFEKSEGAVVFRGSHTRVFVNSQGLPTYEAKELGLLALKKQKGDFDLSLTITANETRDFFAVVRQAAQKIFPDLERQITVRFHGLMKLSSGKMSSRTGNIVTGESLLEDLQKAARGRENVAVGAVKYAVLKQGSGKDIVFDPEKSLSLEGDSGPYLQYAHVRARSLLREAKKAGIEASRPQADGKTWPSGPERRLSGACSLEHVLIHFPEVVARAAKELEPHYVTTYLTELASAFNSWYASERVIGGANPSYGVLLTQAVEATLAKGLYVLGIPAPEEM